MTHVFLSYVRDDQTVVDRLVSDLKRRGVHAWVDREQIKPGEHWQDAIAVAINDGAFFIACFSRAHAKRAESYMNEELTVAIDRLRKRSRDRAWFIPILLDDTEVPARPIGAGESLRDIQWVDLHADWEKGIRRLIDVIGPAEVSTQEVLEAIRLPEIAPEVWSSLRGQVARARCVAVVGARCSPRVLPVITEALAGRAPGEGSVGPYGSEDPAEVAERAYLSASGWEVRDVVARLLKAVPDEAAADYEVLAASPFAVYLTTNQDDLLSKALAKAGRQAVAGVCPWYDDAGFHWSDARPGREPHVEPTVERPLVFHLFGHVSIPQSLVLSDSDYRAFSSALARDHGCLPPRLAAELVRAPVVFLGYASYDRALREVTHCLEPFIRRNYVQPPHAIQISPGVEIEWLRSRVATNQLVDAATEHFSRLASSYASRGSHALWGDVDPVVRKLAGLN